MARCDYGFSALPNPALGGPTDRGHRVWLRWRRGRGVVRHQRSGGITIAQKLETAGHPDMPESAIASGYIDFVLSPEDIAQEIVRIAHEQEEGISRTSRIKPFPSPPSTTRNGSAITRSGRTPCARRRAWHAVSPFAPGCEYWISAAARPLARFSCPSLGGRRRDVPQREPQARGRPGMRGERLSVAGGRAQPAFAKDFFDAVIAIDPVLYYETLSGTARHCYVPPAVSAVYGGRVGQSWMSLLLLLIFSVDDFSVAGQPRLSTWCPKSDVLSAD
jgi:hypothetical protein